MRSSSTGSEHDREMAARRVVNNGTEQDGTKVIEREIDAERWRV